MSDEELARLVDVIGKFWLIPRDEFALAHAATEYRGPQGVVTTYISFVRKDAKA
jgi:hypothetical protein